MKTLNIKLNKLIMPIVVSGIIFLLGYSTAEAAWQKMNGGYAIGPEATSFPIQGLFPHSYNAAAETIVDKEGNIIYFFRSKMGLCMGRFNASSKKWEIWSFEGWSDKADAIEKPISGGLLYDYEDVRMFNRPGDETGIFGCMESSTLVGGGDMDVHPKYFNIMFDGSTWKFWSGNAGYDKYYYNQLLASLAEEEGAFAFDGENEGMAAVGYGIGSTLLTALKYEHNASDLKWKLWRGDRWEGNDGYVRSYVPIPDAQPRSDEHFAEPHVVYLNGTKDYIVFFTYSKSDHVLVPTAAIFRGDPPSPHWEYWNGAGWQTGDPAGEPFAYGALPFDVPHDNFLSGFFTTPVHNSGIISMDNGDIAVVSAKSNGVDEQNRPKYILTEHLYSKEAETWASNAIIEVISAEYKMLHRLAKDNSDNLWLFYQDYDYTLKVMKKINGTWTAPENVLSYPTGIFVRITHVEFIQDHDLQGAPYEVPILFIFEAPVMGFGKLAGPYVISKGEMPFWDGETPVDRRRQYPDIILDSTTFRPVNMWQNSVPGIPSYAGGPFNNMDVDTEGNIYCPIAMTCQVNIWPNNSPNGTPHGWGAFWDYFRHPSGVAVDDTRGKVYISDCLLTPDGVSGYISGTVRIWDKEKNDEDVWYRDYLDRNSRPQTYFPSYIAGTEFKWPSDVCVDEERGYLYVSNSMYNRIEKFDITGPMPVKIGSVGTEGKGFGQFAFPQGLDVDKYGNLYVVDTQNHRIQKFDSNGMFLLSFGKLGRGEGEFIYPYGIAIDPRTSYVYVSDPYNGNLQVFASDGRFLHMGNAYRYGSGVRYFGKHAGIVIDENGNLFTGAADSYIVKYKINYLPPDLAPVGGKIITEGEPALFLITADDINNDPLILTAERANGNHDSVATIGASFIDNRDETGAFLWTPAIGQRGNYDISFIATDSSSLSDSETITITVVPDTTLPVISITAPQNNTFTTNHRPSFHAEVSDNAELKYAVLRLDGIAVPFKVNGVFPPVSVSLSGTQAAIDYTPKTDLSDGTHSYEIGVWDNSYNYHHALTEFTVYTYVSPPSNGDGCFLAGTPILMADRTTKPIEDIKVGDKILAYDEDSGEIKLDKVKRTFVFPEEPGYLVINEHIKVTEKHRFYTVSDLRLAVSGNNVENRTPNTENRYEWREAGSLKLGDRMLTSKDTLEPITSIERIEAKVTVYNLEVNPYHTFIANNVVVHNAALKDRIQPRDPGPVTK